MVFYVRKNVKTEKKTLLFFNSGDIVYVSKHKITFEKGYETKWTEKMFLVTECVMRIPPAYRIKYLVDKHTEETFYAEKLQKIQFRKHFNIEKILKKRKGKGQLEYQIKF